MFQSILSNELFGQVLAQPSPPTPSRTVEPPTVRHAPSAVTSFLSFRPSRTSTKRVRQSHEGDEMMKRVSSVALAGFLSFESQVELRANNRSRWSIPAVPVKVLDAPNLSDRITPSLLDWSSNGTLVVGLPDNVYTLPNAGSQSPGQVTRIPDSHAVSEPGAVRWSPNVSACIATPPTSLAC